MFWILMKPLLHYENEMVHWEKIIHFICFKHLSIVLYLYFMFLFYKNTVLVL